MSWDDQNGANSGRYGDQDFRGQDRFNDPSGGRYGQGGYDQAADRWPSHRGDWGQGRIEPRGYRGEDQYGNASDGSMGGYAGQGYGQGQHYGGQGGSQQSRGQGYDQQGYRGQDQMSGQGDWNQSYGSQGGYGGNQGRLSSSTTFTYTELWLIPGPRSGRGPRGYQRSSQRIEEDVCERLSQHGQLDASNIEVKVENGEVILTGAVGSRQEKRMAEDALDSISGIKGIHNHLRVQQDQSDGQGSKSGRASEGQNRQSRSGKENANTGREKEAAAASAG